MSGFDGALARQLYFGDEPATTSSTARSSRAALRLAPAARLSGPDKYKVLDLRRRRAQIKARRLLELCETR